MLGFEGGRVLRVGLPGEVRMVAFELRPGHVFIICKGLEVGME